MGAASFAKTADSLDVKRPKAKWRGGATIEGGTNFHADFLNDKTHNLGNLGANVGFTKGQFDLDAKTNLFYEHKITGKAAGNVKIADNDTTMTADLSVNEETRFNTQSSLNMKWRPGRYQYQAYYTFASTANTPNNYNLTKISKEEVAVGYNYSEETGSKYTNRHQTGINLERPDAKRKNNKLKAGLDIDLFTSDTYSEWCTGRAVVEAGKEVKDITDIKVKKNIEDKHYRQTPSSGYWDSRLSIQYSCKNLFKVQNLNTDFGGKVQYKNLQEEMRSATYVHKEWRDSLSAREDFMYYTLSIMPSLHVNFKRGIYTLDFNYSPEYFTYALDGDDRKGNVKKGKIANLLEMTHTFKPWPRHTFTARYKRTDERPNYQQICWFPRFSSIYANEVYVGNPDLNNSTTSVGRLAYEFSAKRFSTLLELSDTYMPRKIAKTYNNETYEGKEYRIYTWINGGLSNEFNVNLTSKWTGPRLGLALTGKYKYYVGYSASGNRTKSSEYTVSANGLYNIKTWKIEANGTYQSGINRSYYSMSSIIDGNFKVTKAFGKRLSVYLFGQNLLDRPVLVETKSEDEKEIRYEQLLTYKRLVKLGVNLKF